MENKVETNDQIITLDEVDYRYSELTDDGKIIVNQLNIIEREVLQTRMLLDRHEAAKITFIARFKEIVAEVEIEEWVSVTLSKTHTAYVFFYTYNIINIINTISIFHKRSKKV